MRALLAVKARLNRVEYLSFLSPPPFFFFSLLSSFFFSLLQKAPGFCRWVPVGAVPAPAAFHRGANPAHGPGLSPVGSPSTVAQSKLLRLRDEEVFGARTCEVPGGVSRDFGAWKEPLPFGRRSCGSESSGRFAADANWKASIWKAEL